MTIKEVSERFGVSTDTLRYYERIGLIPQIARTAGGIRDYTESDISWVEHTICMRNAGVPIEALIENTMERLQYKISKYENAIKTGELTWDK